MNTEKRHVQEFDANRVRPLPDQPRKRFRGIRELADSILEVGQATPGIVTLVDGDPHFDAQLVDGERRLRACTLAGVPFRAEVRPDTAADEIFVASFAANFGKQDHDVLEIAHGLDRMNRSGKSMVQLARIAGKSATWVAQHLSLLKLHESVQEMLVPRADEDAPRLALSVALLLVPLEHDDQIKLAQSISAGEGMSMAGARRLVLRARAESGEALAYTGGGGKRRSLETLYSIIDDTKNRIGVYLDMPGPEINALIDRLSPKANQSLAEALDDLGTDLGAMATAIRRRATTGARKAS